VPDAAPPPWVWPALAAGLGPIAGSFIGLLTLRLPDERSVVAARSACAACGRTLGVLDLVPLLSFAALRGRCRRCGEPIPRRYPALELGCLLVALWGALVVPGPAGLLTAALGWWLLLIAVIDAERFWLPDRLTLPLAAAGLLAAPLEGAGALADRALGAAIGFAGLAGLAWLYRRLRGREGLGGGDARLLAAAGAWTGWAGLPSVLVWASLAGFSVLAAALLTGRRLRGDDALPFGSFLALGIWLVWLYGPLGR